MVYQDKFVVAIRCNGKILREDQDVVTLPFSSSYEILLKNLSTRKAQVKISVDGQDVLDGQSLVVFPNSNSELTGFLKNLNVTNKFKFIQKTEEISEFRGDKIDDGMIRVEYAFEKEIEKTILYETHIYHDVQHHYPMYYTQNPFWSNSIGGSSVSSSPPSSTLTRSCSSHQVLNCSINNSNTPNDGINALLGNNIDQGITVKGEETIQRFNSTSIGQLENPKVLIIRLRGINNNGNIVEQPIMSQEKIQCNTCGRKNESLFKFCSNCGTSLR
jgi:hypothetical protein